MLDALDDIPLGLRPEDYDTWYAMPGTIHWEDAPSKTVTLNALSACCPSQGPLRLLDIACGTGKFLKKIRQTVSDVWHLYGVDFSSVAIDMAKELDEQANLQLNLFCEDATQMHFDSGFFDVITCCGSWEHFENPQLALEEHARVLKVGGWFFGMIPVLGVDRTDRDDEGWYEEKPIPGHTLRQMQWNLKQETWETLFARAGLQTFDDSFAKGCGAIKPKVFFFGVRLNRPVWQDKRE
jgi:ubiquinone/menaquinone biosynthesis C-methylase UbiE